MWNIWVEENGKGMPRVEGCGFHESRIGTHIEQPDWNLTSSWSICFIKWVNCLRKWGIEIEFSQHYSSSDNEYQPATATLPEKNSFRFAVFSTLYSSLFLFFSLFCYIFFLVYVWVVVLFFQFFLRSPLPYRYFMRMRMCMTMLPYVCTCYWTMWISLLLFLPF